MSAAASLEPPGLTPSVVGILGARPKTPISTSFLDLFVDDRLEGLERLSTREIAAVDEKRRRRIHADALARLDVLRDVAAELPRVQAFAERLRVETELLCELTVGLG
jgi:hypothetical protein